MAEIDDRIQTYLAACAVEGKTDNTVASYRASLADFRRVGARLALPDDLAGYALPHVYTFLHDVRSRGATPAYQHRRHREVKAFFSWCKRMGMVEDNVFAKVPLVKLEQQIVQPYNADEMQAILASQDPATHSGCRNFALFLFLLDTGVRASECISVRLDDVEWDNGRVRVLHGKGKKQRWVGIGERTMDALRGYIARFRTDQPGALFRTTDHKPFASPHALNVILQRVAARTALTKVHPHRFRHTFATWAIRAQAREIDVQSLLGHSSLTMVQRYARTYTSEEAVAAHARFSPVGQLAPAMEVAEPIVVQPEHRPRDLTSGANGARHVAPQYKRRCEMAIEKRELEPGTPLVATYKRRTHVCTVEQGEDRKPAYVLEDGRRFGSPSAAASAVMGGIAANGWRFWTVEVTEPAEAPSELQPRTAAKAKAVTEPRTGGKRANRESNGHGSHPLLHPTSIQEGVADGETA